MKTPFPNATRYRCVIAGLFPIVRNTRVPGAANLKLHDAGKH